MTHLLGFSDLAGSFRTRAASGAFDGPAVRAVAGGRVALAFDSSHWADDTSIDGVGAMMTSFTIAGTTPVPTRLDWAALADIGWEIAVPAATRSQLTFDSAEVPNGGHIGIWVTTPDGVNVQFGIRPLLPDEVEAHNSAGS